MAVGFFSSRDDLSDIINSVHEPITTYKFASFPSNETDTIFPSSLLSLSSFSSFFLYLLFSTSSFSEKFPLHFLYFFPSLSLVYSVCIHFLFASHSSSSSDDDHKKKKECLLIFSKYFEWEKKT